MKNMKLYSIFLALFAVIMIYSCQKEQAELTPENGTAGNTQSQNGGSAAGCNNVVEYDGARLVFDDMSEFEAVYQCLMAEYQQNLTEFVGSHEGLTEEELIELAASTGFSHYAPLQSFESGFDGYVSLRAALVDAEEAWMATAELEEDSDPYASIPLDRVLSTLVNKGGEVLVGGQIVNFLSGPEGERECAMSSNKVANDNTCGNRKQVSRNYHVNLSPFSWSYYGGTTEAYRRALGKWWPALLTVVKTTKKGKLFRPGCEADLPFTNNTLSFLYICVNVEFFSGSRHKTDQVTASTIHETPTCNFSRTINL